jgi:hypothetical protein
MRVFSQIGKGAFPFNFWENNSIFSKGEEISMFLIEFQRKIA